MSREDVAQVFLFTDWDLIGKSIGEFVAAIEWGNFLKKAAKAFWEAFGAALTTYSNAFNEAPIAAAIVATLGINTVLKKIYKSGVVKKLSTLFSELGSGISSTGTFSANTTKLISNLHNKLGTLGNTILGVSAGIMGFSSIYSTFKGLADGTTSFSDALLSLVGTLALVAPAMIVAFDSTPIGLAVTAAIALTAALTAITVELVNAPIEEAGERLYSALTNPNGVSIDDLTESVSTSISSVSESVSGIIEASENLEESNGALSDTKAAIDDITNAWENGVEITAEDIEELQELYSTLYEESKDVLQDQYDVVYSALAGSLGEALTDAGYSVTEYQLMLAELNNDISAAIDTLIEEQENLYQQYEDGEITYDEYIEKNEELTDKLAELQETSSASADAISVLQDDIDAIDFSAIVDEEGKLDETKLTEYIEKISNAYDTAEDDITTAHNSTIEALEAYREAAVELGNEEAIIDIDKLISVEEEDYENSLAELEDVVSEYANNLTLGLGEATTEAVNTAIEEGASANVIDEMTSAYIENLSVLESTVQESLDGIEWEIPEDATVADLLSQLVETDTNWLGLEVKSIASDYQDMIEEAFDRLDLSSEYEVYGTYIGEGVSAGITSTASLQAIKSATDTISDAGKKEYTSENGINSPSTVYATYSSYIVKGIALGITDNLALATNSIRTLSSKMKTTLLSAKTVNAATSVGENIVKGIISGINSMRTQLLESVEELAESITGTVSITLDINSPSKVMESLGEYTIEGFKLGMENLYADTTASLARFGNNLTLTATPTIDAYSTVQYQTPSYGSDLSSDIQSAIYSGAASSRNTTSDLLVQILSAIKQGQSITVDGNEITKAVNNRNSRRGISFV